MKTETVTVSYTGWDWDDLYVMKSPTGRVLRVKPNGHWYDSGCQEDVRLTEEEEALLARICKLYQGEGSLRWSDETELVVTHDEMRLFKSASEKTTRWVRRRGA